MPRYFLGRIWMGDCDKAFDADSNHLTLLLLLPGWISTLMHFQAWPWLPCWWPAHNNSKCSPFNFPGLACPLAFRLWLCWRGLILLCVPSWLAPAAEKQRNASPCKRLLLSIADIQTIIMALLPWGLSQVPVQPRGKGRKEPWETALSCLGYEMRFTHELIINLWKTQLNVKILLCQSVLGFSWTKFGFCAIECWDVWILAEYRTVVIIFVCADGLKIGILPPSLHRWENDVEEWVTSVWKRNEG